MLEEEEYFELTSRCTFLFLRFATDLFSQSVFLLLLMLPHFELPLILEELVLHLSFSAYLKVFNEWSADELHGDTQAII